MRQPFPCLWFDGHAEETAAFYCARRVMEAMLAMGKIEVSELERAADAA